MNKTTPSVAKLSPHKMQKIRKIHSCLGAGADDKTE